VRQLALENVDVVIHGRDEQRGKRLADDLTRTGGHAVFIAADLTVATDIARLTSQAKAAFGAIDILVSNAAMYPQHTWFDSSADEWTRYYELNVVAGVRLIQALVPDMTRARWGRVIQKSPVGKACGRLRICPATRRRKPPSITRRQACVRQASLCPPLAGSGVRVNAIAAGLIRTPEVENWFHAEAKTRGWGDRWEEIEAKILERYLPIPVGHIGSTDDVARVVAFLASPIAEYVNGAVIRVDGGSHTWAG
jgi:3-oxoacyl-[acyl-carrier protein] reductase